MRYFIVGLLFIATAATGCGNSDVAQREPVTVPVESTKSDEVKAAETLNRMLNVASEGNWEAYVDEYYGERSKFRSPADRDALVKRFEEKWSEVTVQGLTRATEFPAQIDADKATFLDGEETVFILHRSESGDWKFHL